MERLVPLANTCPPALRRAARWLAVALVAGVLGHLVLSSGGDGTPEIEGWLYTAVIAGSGALCALRATAIARDRAVWLLMALGIGCSSVGNVLYYGVLIDLTPAPFPSIADAAWVLFFPPTYVALGLFVSRHLRHLPRSTWLDGAIGALALASLVSGVVLPSVVASTSGAQFAAVATTLVYPCADLLLLVMVVVTIGLGGWRPGGAMGLLALGLAVTAGADTIYCMRTALGSYVDGTPLDSVWPAGMVLIGLAAWQPIRPPRGRLEGAAALAVPYAFTLVSVGLLVVDHFAQLSVVSLVLAAAGIGLCGYRTLRTFTELRDLGDSRRLALTDDLTGLGNRRDLLRRLAQIEDGAPEGDSSLLLLDLDRFKELNDTLGHAAGDEVLERIAVRLRRALPPDASLCRLGGDEFAAVLSRDHGDRDQAAAVARRLRLAVQQPLRIRDLDLRVDTSIGIATFPHDGRSASELLQRADVAMYDAKRSGTGVAQYDPQVDGHSRERLALFGDLRTAIPAGQLILHYQPLLDLRTHEVHDVEALVRWNHPERGLLQPGTFIPLVERSDLMRALTLSVIAQACRQVADWRSRGLDLCVAVNIAVPNLLDMHFPQAVGRLLEDSAVPASALRLEITENVAMADPTRAAAVLRGLTDLGVALSLYDFGTGHSSLAHMKKLPVSTLKIDRTFVMGMSADPLDAAIVRSTIDLAHNLGLTVVAEGVEDDTALATLDEMRCDVVQGYHVSRPVAP
ncbi:MAG TPA: bifunctional diguanylate cyclase/phosphodiesterase, partial [Gaiellales bacterium]|nr:bifunctional diguanylate cyclase/phosphodiesterase [Gaiellales bacterium]